MLTLTLYELMYITVVSDNYLEQKHVILEKNIRQPFIRPLRLIADVASTFVHQFKFPELTYSKLVMAIWEYNKASVFINKAK